MDRWLRQERYAGDRADDIRISPLGAGLIWLGIALFGAVVVFQLVNLPVEFNASARAKVQLVSLGIINDEELTYVSKVLNAAALTYLATTLQAVLTLLYYVMRFIPCTGESETFFRRRETSHFRPCGVLRRQPPRLRK